jgi:hypothetical protein
LRALSGGAGAVPGAGSQVDMSGSPLNETQARMRELYEAQQDLIRENRAQRPSLAKEQEQAKYRFLATFGGLLASGKGNFAQAFGSALVPATQMYADEMHKINKQIHEQYKDDIDAYKSQSEALYRSGKLSQDEFNTRMHVAGQLEAARINASATMGAASISADSRMQRAQADAVIRQARIDESNRASRVREFGIFDNSARKHEEDIRKVLSDITKLDTSGLKNIDPISYSRQMTDLKGQLTSLQAGLGIAKANAYGAGVRAGIYRDLSVDRGNANQDASGGGWD